ncbi:MAG: hypothetical protein JNL98_32825, partial [Bryobacterales bacterium]|nr:hypothetical protein [Bryobacterales bacterium]
AYDPEAQTLRAIEGVPGAAILGDPIFLEARLTGAVVAPNRRFALARSEDRPELLLVRLDGGTGQVFSTRMPPGEVAFSPGGSSVAIVTGRDVEIWTGLPDAPVRLSSLRPQGAAMSKVAVSDDGTAVVALAGGDLWRLTAEGPQALASEVRDMQFAANSHQLLVALADRIASIAKVSQDKDLATVVDGVAGIEKLALAANGRLVAGMDAERHLVVADLTTLASARIAGPENADCLLRAQGDAVFQLTASASGELWLLDASGAQPRIVSVQKRSDQ